MCPYVRGSRSFRRPSVGISSRWLWDPPSPDAPRRGGFTPQAPVTRLRICWAWVHRDSVGTDQNRTNGRLVWRPAEGPWKDLCGRPGPGLESIPLRGRNRA